MKIYFAGSIRGGRDDREIYFSIIKELGKYGTVLTEHIGAIDLDAAGERGMTDMQIFERDMAWVRESDVVVAEVTTASLGVGYELGQAQAMGKPVICLYRKMEGKLLSAMFTGNSYMQIFQYMNLEDAAKIVADRKELR
ncbi:MAG: hypothetical protein JWO73_650 [Candidatus Taylorbacteria bacterium]|nr:hypothetical protein [Candidatus Taylorbacteria bacterium]